MFDLERRWTRRGITGWHGRCTRGGGCVVLGLGRARAQRRRGVVVSELVIRWMCVGVVLARHYLNKSVKFCLILTLGADLRTLRECYWAAERDGNESVMFWVVEYRI